MILVTGLLLTCMQFWVWTIYEGCPCVRRAPMKWNTNIAIIL